MQNTRPFTSRDVVELIHRNIGVAWREETVDTFKSGNPDAPIGGIAVTMMATLDVDASYHAFGTNVHIARQQPPLCRQGIFCK